MTTPQNELYNLSYKIKTFIDMFKVEEGKEDLFKQVNQLYIGRDEVIRRLDVVEGQMALIIKLLTKKEK